MRICTECPNFLDKDPKRDIWYNQFCMAVKLPTGTNPINGKVMPFNKNDLGMKYFTENEYEYARNVNTGNCKIKPSKNPAKVIKLKILQIPT